MKKILLSHKPGTGGDLIASMLSKQRTTISNKGIVQISGNFKNREFDLIRFNKKESIKKEIVNLFKKTNIITTHLTNIKIINHDLIKIRTSWNNKELGKWFAIRDLLTTNVIKNLPYYYNDCNFVIKKIMNNNLNETKKILIFFENHYKNGGWYNKESKLDNNWKILNIDNILDNFCFIKDLEKFCVKMNIPFNRTFAKNLHNKWLKKNNKKQINLEKYVEYFKKNNFIELILRKIKNND